MEYTYDLNKLHAQCNNDEAFIKRMLNVYKEELTNYEYQLRNGLKNNNIEKLKATTHSMIPAMKLLGANDAAKDLRHITDSILEENSIYPFEETINTLANFCSELQQDLLSE